MFHLLPWMKPRLSRYWWAGMVPENQPLSRAISGLLTIRVTGRSVSDGLILTRMGAHEIASIGVVHA